jgi:hypothetical protein
MQRLFIVVGLVAAAVVLQGCNVNKQAEADHKVAVTSGCDTAVDEKLKPSVDKYNTDSQAYCDTLALPTDTTKKAVCTLKRTMFQPLCGIATRWKLACVNANSETVMNATAIEVAVTAYIEGSDTEAADGMISGFVTQTDLCSTNAIKSIKDAVAAPRVAIQFGTTAKPQAASRLYDATAKPQAAEPFFFAMSGFVIVMVVGSVAFGVKRFVRNRMIGTGVAEADQEAQALVEHLGEVE